MIKFVYSFFSIKIREGKKYLALESCELLLAGQKPFRCLTYPSLSSDFVLFNSRLRFAFSLSSLEISPSSSRTVSWNTISQAKINNITTDIYILPSFIRRQDKVSWLYLTRYDEKTTAIFASDGRRMSWLLTVLGKVFSPQPNNFIFLKTICCFVLLYSELIWYADTCVRYDVVNEFLWKSNDHYSFFVYTIYIRTSWSKYLVCSNHFLSWSKCMTHSFITYKGLPRTVSSCLSNDCHLLPSYWLIPLSMLVLWSIPGAAVRVLLGAKRAGKRSWSPTVG